jgi:hypothetical protein
MFGKTTIVLGAITLIATVPAMGALISKNKKTTSCMSSASSKAPLNTATFDSLGKSDVTK